MIEFESNHVRTWLSDRGHCDGRLNDEDKHGDKEDKDH